MPATPGPPPRGRRSIGSKHECASDSSTPLRPADARLPSRSWARARSGDRQAVAHIRQIVFDIAVELVLRLERHAAHLNVASNKSPACRSHATPLRTVDRQRRNKSKRGSENLGANMIAGALHMAVGA